MRQSEMDYWDNEAEGRANLETVKIADNIWKRAEQMKYLLSSDLMFRNVLEIGVGLGTAAAALNTIFLGNWKYIATDVSPKFCDFVRRKSQLNVVNTDILELPEVEGGFSRIICLDSLEHVRPEDRLDGYREINRVMSKHGRILINMPLEETHHNLEFDHPFDMNDIKDIMRITGCTLNYYGQWQAIHAPSKPCYAWVELVK